MGFAPEVVDRMSIWQFSAAVIGWSRQYEDPSKLNDADKDELWDWMIEKNDVPLSSGRYKKLNGN
jgi:hypothetical protein